METVLIQNEELKKSYISQTFQQHIDMTYLVLFENLFCFKNIV